MNKHKFLAALLSAGVLFTACKKTDVQQNATSQQTSASAAATTASEWKTVSNWSSEKDENYSTYTSKVEDNSITADVVSKGLVLVYKKSSSSVDALPFEEKAANGSYFWYYQVSQGSITFSADAYGSATAPGADLGFRYFVLSSEKLKELESKGYTKSQLMRLTYENAAGLLK